MSVGILGLVMVVQSLFATATEAPVCLESARVMGSAMAYFSGGVAAGWDSSKSNLVDRAKAYEPGLNIDFHKKSTFEGTVYETYDVYLERQEGQPRDTSIAFLRFKVLRNDSLCVLDELTLWRKGAQASVQK